MRAVRAGDLPWVESPAPGVWRRMLYREGEEVAVATSLVRYAPGASFPAHVHGGGEEILVLEGVFSDEHGHHPAGTWLVNPVGSSHAPYSEAGCLLFVRLRQLGPSDPAHRCTGSLSEPRILSHSAALRRLPTAPLPGEAHEMLVLEGELRWAGEIWGPGSWLQWRDEPGPELQTPQPALVWHKVVSP